MHLKILVATDSKNDLELIQKALIEIAEQGAELFFVQDEKGLEWVLEKEKPKLLFLESKFAQKIDKIKEESYVILIGQRDEKLSERDLHRPLKERAILEKCHEFMAKNSFDPFTTLPI